MNRIMKLTWFWKCENDFCSGYLFVYYLCLFCAYILVCWSSSVRYLDSWMDLFCLKEYFTLVNWLMHSSCASFPYTCQQWVQMFTWIVSWLYCSRKKSNYLLSFPSQENVQLLEIPAIEFFPEIVFVCYCFFILSETTLEASWLLQF